MIEVGMPLDVSVIIVNWRTRDLLRECLAALYQHTRSVSFEVFVVDNDSGDGSASMVSQEFAAARLIVNDQNVGFAKANNQVFGNCRGRHILLLNPDTRVEEGAVDAMVSRLDSRPTVGALGPKIVQPDGKLRVLHAGEQPSLRTAFNHYTGLSRAFPRSRWFRGTNLISGLHDKVPLEVGWISGACVMVRGEVVRSVGPLSERWFMYAEDMEWCDRMTRAGWVLEHYPGAVVVHHVGAASRQGKSTSVMWLKSLRSWYVQRSGAGPVRAGLFDSTLTVGLGARAGAAAFLGLIRPRARELKWSQAREFAAYAKSVRFGKKK